LAVGDRDPSFLTHREIDATLELLDDGTDRRWIGTGRLGPEDLASADGIWLLPGTPYQRDAAAFSAIDHCVATAKPFLGTCGGFQYACVALARTRAGFTDASHAESDPGGPQQVITPLACSLYGQYRVVRPVAGTLFASICGVEPFEGFHWCGYGVADRFNSELEKAGVVLSAFGDDVGAEAIELADHPFFVATAFQPQVGAGSSGRLHPLIEAFVSAASSRSRAMESTT
jgi:CTP synthase (UTP-ammonia lyase)